MSIPRSSLLIFLLLVLLLIVLSLTYFFFQPHQGTPSSTTATATSSASSTPSTMSIALERLELVTNNAFGDGNTYVPNGWGVHKNRIVRTNSGDIFVVYFAAGSDMTNRQWRLMHRAPDGTWTQIDQGNAGTEPINIMRGPSDDLNLFAWPGTDGKLQYIHSTDLGKTFTTTSVPGQWTTNQGYSGSGINDKGDMVVFQTGDDKPGNFYWAYYTASSNQWHFSTSTFDYRYTYAFFFPGDNGGLTMVGMRDVLRPELGYPSSNGFNYIFNALKYFQSDNLNNPQMDQLLLAQVQPQNNTDYDITYLSDVYNDTQGRTHVLYNNLYDGPHHLIIQDGKVIKDVKENIRYGTKMRILQDATGHFYIIAVDNNSLNVYPGSAGDTDGTQLDPPVSLDISQYPGCTDDDFCMSPTLTVPRNGHALQDYVDGVYGNLNKVIYFRVQLRKPSPVSQGQSLTKPILAQLDLYNAVLEGDVLDCASSRRNNPWGPHV